MKEDKTASAGGNSYVENHIDNVETFAPRAEKVENNHTHTVTVQINISISFHLHASSFARWFEALKGKLGLSAVKLHETRFDGGCSSDAPVCQLSGSPADIAAALRLLDLELGREAEVSVRYISRVNRFERKSLTLSQSISLAEYESRL